MSFRGLVALSIVYPILFAIYPVLALLAGNLGEMPSSDAFRSLVIASLVGVFLWVILSILFRNREKGALLASGYIILFFSYGQIYDQVEGLSLGPILVGRHRYLIVIWVVVVIIWSVWILKQKDINARLKQGLLVAAITLVALPVISIARYNLADAEVRGSPPSVRAVDAEESLERAVFPDIYYIIVDAYGRFDILQELYGIDNADFLEFLESRGFYVASHSTSNYALTHLSLSSSLNMRYLDDIVENEGSDSENLLPLYEMIAHSKIREVFAQMGYKFVAFESGKYRYEVRDADYFYSPNYWKYRDTSSVISLLDLNEFEGMLLSTSLLRAANEFYTRSQISDRGLLEDHYQKHRIRVKFTLESLGKIAGMEGQFFVFAHIISPHSPFVFGRFGEVVNHSEAFSLIEKGSNDTSRQYANQTVYITKLLERTIDEIFANSVSPPIIIIQSDHGPRTFSSRNELSFDISMREQMSILNAYFIPGDTYGLLYPSITPVNSFRVLLSRYFGLPVELLEDENYFSSPEEPYNTTRVTDILKDLP